MAELENLIFFEKRCIGAGCEPRVRPLPGQDGQGVSLAAPAEADQVEDTPTSYQQLEDRIRQMRRDHHGCTSRGLDVELARYFYESPIPGDFLPALLLDLQQCAAACIGAGCEPLVRPLPGQSAGVARLAAAAHAHQVEGTPTRFPPLPGHRPDCGCVSCEFPPRGSPRRGPVAPAPRHPFAAYLASCLRDCRNEMKTADVFDRLVIQGRMNDILRASALYSDFLQECGN